MIFTVQFMIAVLLDFVFGDPRALPHPVRGIGLFCTFFEKLYRNVCKNLYIAGFLSFFSVWLSVVLPLLLTLFVLHRYSPILEAVFAIVVLYTSIAYRDLRIHSMRVYSALASGEGLEQARKEIGRIVGRDTSELNEQGICRACVETVAENMVDGIVAPMFYALLLSFFTPDAHFLPISMAALGAYCYKAINTMDSMYGYKNESYLEFGRTAAKIDDFVNFIPARISGILLVCAAWILRLDYKQSLRVFIRDRFEHASPNGGHPEAAVAGSLGIQLGGAVSYFGTRIEKPTMGDNLRLITTADILLTNRLMFVGCSLFLVIMLGITNIVF